MSLEMLPAWTLGQAQSAAGEKGMEEKELFKEMAKLDRELLAMIEEDPELGEIYSQELGESPGSVVYLPRAPTPADWARARELADRK